MDHVDSIIFVNDIDNLQRSSTPAAFPHHPLLLGIAEWVGACRIANNFFHLVRFRTMSADVVDVPIVPAKLHSGPFRSALWRFAQCLEFSFALAPFLGCQRLYGAGRRQLEAR